MQTTTTYTDIDARSPAVNLKYRPEIDTLRAIAVIAVMLSHWVPGFPRPLNWGLVGVFAFFTISGYVITRGLLHEKHADGINLRAFYWRRALRIWPVYYLTIAFIYFVWPGFTKGGIPWHMLFLSNAFFAIKGQFLFPIHFWSLSVEEQFYLFWPLLMMLPVRSVAIVCVAMVIVAPISRWYFASHVGNVPASYFALSSNLDCLAAGAMLAMLERDGRSVPGWVGAAGAVLLAALAIASAAGAHTAGDWPMASASAAICAWLISWLARSPRAVAHLDNRALRDVGRVSYGIYIYHVLVGGYLLHTRIAQQPPVISAVVAMAATLAIASISWHLVERPILSLKRLKLVTRK